MTKKKKKTKITDGPSYEGPLVLYAHAGEYKQNVGTFITYRLRGMTHQAFYSWGTNECTVLVTEIEDKVCNTK
jgi:hypothetical protein